MEHAVFDLEVPVAVVLAAPQIRQVAQPGFVGQLNTAPFDHDVESVLPLVAAGREHHLRVPDEVHRLLLGWTGAEVEAVVGPYRRQWCDVRPAVTANR